MDYNTNPFFQLPSFKIRAMKKFIMIFLSAAFFQCCTTDSSGQKDKTKPLEQEKKANINKNNQTQKFIEGKDYLEFVRARVMDKTGFQKPVEVISLLIPKGWKLTGEVTWTAPGQPCEGNNQTISISSPDGKYKFCWLPNEAWMQANYGFQQQQSRGIYCYVGNPIEAKDYFRTNFIPNELPGAKIINIEDNPEAVKIISNNKRNAQVEKEFIARDPSLRFQYFYSAITAKVNWDNGKEAMAVCAVNNTIMHITNQYNGVVTPHAVSTATHRYFIEYPQGEQENASFIMSAIVGSLRTNPAWEESVNQFWRNVREESHKRTIGNIRMMDALTKQMGDNAIARGQQRLNQMDANMRSWEANQSAQDRQHSNFIKGIREVENFRDGNGTVELSSGYNHAWSRSDGSSYILTNNPNVDPSSIYQDNQWKEMKRVD